MNDSKQNQFSKWLAQTYSLDAAAIDRLQALARESIAVDISGTAVRTEMDAMRLHIADSLSGLSVPAIAEAGTLIDIGTGIGFPGLALAIARPSLKITLIDSVGKKIEVAAELARELGLSNVEAIWARFEDSSALGSPARESFDVVAARAVAPLTVLLEYALPFLRPAGSLVAWKGSPDATELADAAAAEVSLGFHRGELVPVQPFRGSEKRHFYIASRSGELDDKFPRRPGVALRKPIVAAG